MLKKKPIAIILSLVSILLCSSLAVIGTYALFSDKVEVKSHLKAGTLDATLTRTAYSYSILDEAGHLETTTDSTPTDMEDPSVTNAFGLPSDALIVPESKLSASFNLKNNGNVAFTYSIKILLTDDSNTQILKENANELAKQIKVTFNGSSSYLVEGSFDGTGFVINGETCSLDANADTDFSVEMEFIDSATQGITFINNDAMSQTVYFDLLIEATQLVD